MKEVLAGTEEVCGEGWSLCLMVHCLHGHQNDSAFRWAAMPLMFTVSQLTKLWRAKSLDGIHKPQLCMMVYIYIYTHYIYIHLDDGLSIFILKPVVFNTLTATIQYVECLGTKLKKNTKKTHWIKDNCVVQVGGSEQYCVNVPETETVLVV